MKQLQAMILVVASLVMAQAHADTDADKIRERIKPIAEVCVQGDDCGGPAVAVASGPRSGEAVYTAACAGCHAVGVAGAPKKGDAAAWDKRLAKGFDKTLANAINGLNAMPAKGLCMDCSDDELSAAIKFMTK